MGVSLHWVPVKEGKLIKEGGELLRMALSNEFGSPPWDLGQSSLGFLRGLREGKVPGAGELVDAVAEFDEIRVTAVY